MTASQQEAKSVDITAVGVILIDNLFFVDKLPASGMGALIQSEGVYLGGRAPNVAVMTDALGCQSAIVSVAGSDFVSSGYHQFLASRGIAIDALDIVPNRRTDRSYIFTDQEQRQLTFVDLDAFHEFAIKSPPLNLLAASRVIHVSSGSPEFNLRTVEASLDANAEISFDVGNDVYLHSEEYLRRLLSVSRFVFLNEAEGQYLSDRLGFIGFANVANNWKDARFFVLKDDGEVQVFEDGKDTSFRALPGPPVVDRTGASDGFVAGYLASYLRGLTLADSVALGQLHRGLITSAPGCLSNLCTWDSLVELDQKVRRDFPH